MAALDRIDLQIVGLLRKNARLSNKEIKENGNSSTRINAIRIESEIERREDLDFWAASLQMAGLI